MSADLRTVRERLAGILGEVTSARRMVETGRTVDLTGLDSRICDLCSGVAALPASESREFIQLLEDLQGSLAQLALSLRTSAPPTGPTAHP